MRPLAAQGGDKRRHHEGVDIESTVHTRTVQGRTIHLPDVISVDDHVVEPPDLWTSRLSSKHLAAGPRVVREKGIWAAKRWTVDDVDGQWGDVWYYEKRAIAITMGAAQPGYDLTKRVSQPVTFDDMRPGVWRQRDRLADMDADHVQAAICYPNVLPGPGGETFSIGEDKELGLACIRAYNDWMLDEWCSGEGARRLIPLIITALWDPSVAAAEVRRCAEKGAAAVAFCENPYALGFSTVHSGAWDPFFAACAETGVTLGIHIGSSEQAYTDDPDAPVGTGSTLNFQYALHSLVDLAISGTFERFPSLKVAYAEGNVAWMPFVLERLDHQWQKRMANPLRRINIPEAPSFYIRRQVFGCILDDSVGVGTREFGLGIDRITFESNYPRRNSNFPHTLDAGAKICVDRGLDEPDARKLLRSNAIAAFGLERFGIPV